MKSRGVEKRKIIIAVGGTGGHIFVGLAIAKELERMGQKIVFVSSRFGKAMNLLSGYDIRFTSQRALLKTSFKGKVLFPLSLLLSLLESFYICIKERPKGVIGTGSYGSFSMVFVAAVMGIPTIITEIDSIPGVTTRILSSIVSEVATAFPILNSRKVKITGCPIRKEIFSVKKSEGLRRFNLDVDKPVILVFGGSRGAHSINMAFKEMITQYEGIRDMQFIIATGEDDYEEISKLSCDNVRVEKFIDDIGYAYACSDLCVARAGALTIGEITAVGLPAILIPYPYATGDHQLLNARILKKKGAVSIIKNEELNGKVLFEEIERIIRNDELRQRMRRASKAFGRTDSAEKIAMDIINKKQNV